MADQPMPANRRGHLKIFIGAVPGVGKTYRMLSEAHRRLARGQDIVIGFVETHGRKATEELLKGLEQIPLKTITYRGKEFKEMDTHTVIKRHPEWVLIDELAHTNIPGAEHEKRWQSIGEILNAGINVLSTVNIQHLESMNDAVYQITGVRVKETVPDSIIDEAEEVELVDLSPDAVINRLLRGDIYSKEKVTQALKNFFTKENLIALRELVLRKTTDEVDEQLEALMELSQEYKGKAARDYIMVCVSPQPSSGRLIRRGYGMARRLHAKFDVVFVRIAGTKLNNGTDQVIDHLKQLTSFLGGRFIELTGDSVADEIVKFAGKTGATIMVMGQTRRGRLSEMVGGSLVNHVARETKNIDIILVAPEEAAG